MNAGHDPILGIHATALSMWTRRNEVLASNIANADTPNFKARDLDFAAQLGEAGKQSLDVSTTNARHQTSFGGGFGGGSELLYRTPMQPSLDGNTVETDVEQAKYGENALRYQASLRFVSGRITGLKAAIAGRHP
ncbi:MAG: flagellar basal body rod protein FlgB [Gammaproteobacteria bacterium]